MLPMSKSKNPATYPTEYFDLFRMAASQRVIIPLESVKMANKLRFSLYGFRQALLLHPEIDMDLAQLIEGIQITVDEASLVLLPKDQVKEVQLIRKVLNATD